VEPLAKTQLGALGEQAEQIAKFSELPYRILTVEDPSLPPETQCTLAEGAPGLARVVYRVLYREGLEVLRTLVSQQVIRPPVDAVIARAPGPEGPSRGLPFGGRWLEMEATAYTPYSPGSYGTTAMGVPARRGIVAVDPAVVPLGTRLYIEGYGYAVAADVGGAIEGKRIDLCVETEAEAERFGRRMVRVHILD